LFDGVVVANYRVLFYLIVHVGAPWEQVGAEQSHWQMRLLQRTTAAKQPTVERWVAVLTSTRYAACRATLFSQLSITALIGLVCVTGGQPAANTTNR